jgi:hypothetical protein
MLATPLLSYDIPNALTRPFAAFHIRRGDKVEGYVIDGELIREGDNVAASAYVHLLNRRAPAVRSIFVMTDDYRCVEDVRTAAQGRIVQSLCLPSERGYRQDEFSALDGERKGASLRRLVAETEIAAASSLFIGGFKSNVARFVTLCHHRPGRCFSIDGQKRWSPG